MFKMQGKGLMIASVSVFLVACSTAQLSLETGRNNTQLAVQNVLPLHSAQVTRSSITDTQTLTLEKIMADPDWIGRQPTQAYWADDSQSVFYSQKQHGSPLNDLWSRSLQLQVQPSKVSLSETHQYAYKNRVLDSKRAMAAWVFAGNIFVKDLTTNVLRQLTRDNRQPTQLGFLNDGRLSFQSANGFYAINLQTGLYEQLVTWAFAEKPQAVEPAKDYIAEQQQRLIAVVAKQRQDKRISFERSQLANKENATTVPESFYFSDENEIVEASLSPNGLWVILAERSQSSWRDDGDIMPNYINEDGRISVDKVRRKVADQTPQNQHIWLLDLVKNKKTQLSYNSLPGYNEDVLAQVKRENALAKGEGYKNNRLPREIGLIDDWHWDQSAIQWHASGEQVAVMLEAWDNKDRWLAAVDMPAGTLINQHRLHDDAWINYRFNSFGWLRNSATLYYLSEQSGYAHLYTKAINNKARALTSGPYEVDSLTLSADEQYMYFKANKKHPGIYEIYRVGLQDGLIEPLTNLGGMTDYLLSPDDSRLLLTHSSLTRPPELYLQALSNKAAQQLTYTISQEFLAINWLAPDIVPIDSSHGPHPIFSRVYSPPNADSKTPARAVVFNHGAGYLQNSHLGWSGYFREFMFHNMLAQKGYVVLDMDYRASAGYGRDWRTAIYRQMGTPEIQDLKDGVNWLVDNLNVDVNRVGTYGGSYGGFMTFMAMFNEPDLFKAGAALRPVSDWAHYNNGYTSNILNTPDVDPIAYERSSPIYFAEGLKNPLLINAPMVDDNVFFVDVVRLVQRLIELEKQNFETAIYPVEPHGFVQPSSWLDEYRRIFKLFEQHL
jgi:dipeptidyl aminopeptidase/acylaminoacyl peptidase